LEDPNRLPTWAIEGNPFGKNLLRASAPPDNDLFLSIPEPNTTDIEG
jgi:hypothetical protein